MSRFEEVEDNICHVLEFICKWICDAYFNAN